MSRFKFVGKGGRFSLAVGLAGGLGFPVRGLAFRGYRRFPGRLERQQGVIGFLIGAGESFVRARELLCVIVICARVARDRDLCLFCVLFS